MEMGKKHTLRTVRASLVRIRFFRITEQSINFGILFEALVFVLTQRVLRGNIVGAFSSNSIKELSKWPQ